MGSAESAEARRVSFEMDEEERVRVLQGIRLSESVVNRMKDCSQPSAGEQLVPGFGPSSSAPVPTVPLPAISVPTVPAPTTPVPTAPSSSVRGLPGGTCKGPLTDVKVPSAESGGGLQSSAVKEDLKKFQQEQLAVQDEMVRVAKKEKEAAEKHLKASLPKKKASLTHEQQQSARLNAELYKLSSQQFHEAASKAESTIKPRRVEPVCSGLQAQILRCYRDHLHEVLLCSDLVKAYQHCVSTARKG
ncbi:MICOS complex subunit Mic25 isoform 2 [Mus musculus]|uniref:Coiled-coil-helix-coiled-coil-helix domain containing 6 n=1 Tax=Mus musculus TaxID=10090 RepID=E9Q4M4_MOUSE|nr:MICOS complex subunit Mic25 isoform 2 [Mus musculus]|eukprot:NP_001161208.1 MICOS complex subunit Mic25 isoform 2 [Mus musculus]